MVLLHVILFRPFRAYNVIRNLSQGVALGYGMKLFQSKIIVNKDYTKAYASALKGHNNKAWGNALG